MSEEKSIVLLYYHFTSIEDPKALAAEQRYLCQKLALKGRILVATEGINGTLAGSAAAAQAYQETMSGHPLFKGMEFKISEYATNPFGKLSVKARKEIVTLGVDGPLDTRRGGGEHLSPAQWRQMIEEDPDVVLFDTRNRYESDIGKFKGAVCPDTENFRDLPEKISEYEHLKDKKWLMYCTEGFDVKRRVCCSRKQVFNMFFSSMEALSIIGRKLATTFGKAIALFLMNECLSNRQEPIREIRPKASACIHRSPHKTLSIAFMVLVTS